MLELFVDVRSAKSQNNSEPDCGRVDVGALRRVDQEDVVLVFAPLRGSLETVAFECHLLLELNDTLGTVKFEKC